MKRLHGPLFCMCMALMACGNRGADTPKPDTPANPPPTAVASEPAAEDSIDYTAYGVPATPAATVCSDTASRDAFNAAMNIEAYQFEAAVDAVSGDAPQDQINALMDTGAWTSGDDIAFSNFVLTDSEFNALIQEGANDGQTVAFGLPASDGPEGSVEGAAPLDPVELCVRNVEYHAAFRRQVADQKALVARMQELLDVYVRDRPKPE